MYCSSTHPSRLPAARVPGQNERVCRLHCTGGIPSQGFQFFNKKMVFSFKAVFYLALMLTTVLKAELAVLFTLLTAFTL